MDATNNLKLPYIMAAQAQKHVTHNEAIRALDTLVQLAVETDDLATPPAIPTEGHRYIVAPGAQDMWSGKEGQIAAWQDGGWLFFEPDDGWICFIRGTSRLATYENGVWNTLSADVDDLQNADFVGVRTTADATNRLSVVSDAVLFSHDGSHQRTKINKANASDTASLLFQSQFSGRAEVGLIGDDDFSFKVSADGAAFHEAIHLERSTGKASFPANSVCEHMKCNLFGDGGRFGGAPEPNSVWIGAFSAPGYLAPSNGASFSGAGEFVHNNSTFGGTGAALPVDVEDLISKLKTSQTSRRLGPEFHIMQALAGAGTTSPLTTGGTTRYLLLSNPSNVLMVKSTWGINVRAKTKSIAVKATGNYDLYVDGQLQTTDLVIAPADGWKQLVFVGTRDEPSAPDYDVSLYRIYAEPASQVLLALPFLIPANTRPRTGELFARVPSITLWS